MQSAARPIAALAVVGVLGFLAAGCSAGGTPPAPTPTASTQPTATASASDTASALPTSGSSSGGTVGGAATGRPTTGTSGGSASGGTHGLPSAFPGTGQSSQPDKNPAAFPATALVSFAGWDTASKSLQAGGLVSGTIDTSGTCRFTAKKAGVVRTLTSAAAASASSVNCAQVAFPATQVSSGTWSITLQYAVGAKSTTSDPMTAEVP